MLAHDVMYVSAMHAGFVYGVTDLVKMAAFMAVSSRLSNVEFIHWETAVSVLFNSTLVARIRNASLHGVPFKVRSLGA